MGTLRQLWWPAVSTDDDGRDETFAAERPARVAGDHETKTMATTIFNGWAMICNAGDQCDVEDVGDQQCWKRGGEATSRAATHLHCQCDKLTQMRLVRNCGAIAYYCCYGCARRKTRSSCWFW